MTFAHRVARLALVGGLLAATDASAQVTRPVPAGVQLAGNVYGGYDAPLFADEAFAAFQPTSQAFAGADLSLDYTRPGRRVTTGVVATASNRYYPDFSPSTAPSYGLAVTAASMGQGRWRWGLNAGAQYAPLSAASLFAGSGTTSSGFTNLGATALVSSANLQISVVRQIDVNAAGQLSYSLSRRTHVVLLAGTGTQYQIDTPVPRATRYDARMRVTRDITRGLNAYLGYGTSVLRVPAQGATAASTIHIDGLDFGVGFTRPFQLSRDTTFSVQTGFANVPDSGSNSSLQFIGQAALAHQVTGSWSTQLAVTRDARFVQAYRNPVVVSGVSASIDGQLTRRILSSVVANYSSGRVATSPTSIDFDSYSGSVRLRYDLRPTTGVFAEYNLFRSSFATGAVIPDFPTGTFGRHGVRAGLAFGVSPFNRRR